MASAAAPLLPRTAPFGEDEITALNGVLGGTSPEQRHWLAGFLAGYAAAVANDAQPRAGKGAPAAPAARPAEPLLILYGTESGNSEALAGKLRDAARRQGFKPTLRDMADTSPAEAAKAKNIAVIAATWGEGEPPQRAQAFMEGLLADGAPRFDGVRFAVLALGDTSYAKFCETGRLIDARLEALGGLRATPRIDCDLEFEAPAAAWSKAALEALGPADAGEARGASIIRLHPEASAPAGAHDEAAEAASWSRTRPFEAELVDRVILTSSRSTKLTAHLELSLDGSGIVYEPGDSLAVVPENEAATVAAVMQASGLAGDADLQARLVRDLDVTTLSRPIAERLQKLRPQRALAELLEGDRFQAFAADRQLVDLLEAFPSELSALELTGLLRRLPERSYSIASSPLAHQDEAHLLASLVRWESHGRARKGVASGFLAERLAPGGTARVFLKPNRHFRLPADGALPIVMVGAGTGLAPFRAFLEHRRETGATGRNWLLFGERTMTHEFLYQLELQAFEQEGVLNRIDLAFSRDQPEKIYVQQRLWEARAALWAWLQDGANLYLCGDADQMAKDVEATLLRIAHDQGGLAGDAGKTWLHDLGRSGRLQRDVY